MCGFLSIIGPHPEQLSLQNGLSLLRHRGPDDEGYKYYPCAHMGHARLSILDLSPAGKQPMSLGDQRLAIVHNGEVYNYIELRSELRDVDFNSETDTEVILHLYDKYDQK